ncbi:ABC transporter substrate-binding protein [Corticibacter populi]|uniref:ABC transporter substrate-binding protein n=1 Tax=Corticibacter populi TaxID=1550736 RepID=A0A3M6QSN3_9BURK|nr:ABC transporter substrate-binding protein [Corticibacter populi]RMX05861.1 ABC transporter substrate-binding protein [Corticibacter populi]RZS30821.1 ABC-type nitrate/sulfonate/bicarbonate transport system substrate-binding protein [Corticibacter populi]
MTALDTLWYTRCGVPTSFGVAMHHDWIAQRLAQDGTRIQSLKESPDPAVRASHFDHSLPNSVRYGGASPAIWARSTGRETRLIGLAVTRASQLIVAAPESPLRSVAELKGRRFGVARWHNQPIDFIRATTLRNLENALRLHGLALDDVELVDYPVGARFADEAVHRVPGTQAFGPRKLPGRNGELLALIRGEVDAIYLHGAHAASLAEALQLTHLADIGSQPVPAPHWSHNDNPLLLTVDAHLLDAHPQTAASLVEQILRAEQWGRAHPLELRQIAAREVNTSEYWIWKSYGDEGLQLSTSLAAESLAAVQDFADFLLQRGFIGTRVDVAAWADPRPLEQARERLAAANP